MKALILAGGFGTRLRPLTYTRPKHLLPIVNRPHIEHVLDMLLASDITEVVLTTSYLAQAFAAVAASANERGMMLEVTHEKEPLDTAGALKHAAPVIGDETFLAFNGDILSDLDLRIAVRQHSSAAAEGTIVLTPVEDPSAYGVVPTDRDGRVLGFIEKPAPGTAPTNMINAGVYVLEPSVLDRIPPSIPYNAERQLFPQLAAAGRLFAFPTDAYWMDIGTPEKYLQANLDALRGSFKTEAVEAPGPVSVIAGAGATVAPTAAVSLSCLGDGVEIADNCIVERSVLLPQVAVGEGAELVACVVGEGARIAPGTRLSGAAIADGKSIP